MRARILVVVVLKLCQQWHSMQNKPNRSPKESFVFWQTMACNGGLEHINNILAKLKDVDLFKALRLTLPGQEVVQLHGLSLSDPEVGFQEDMCKTVGDLVCALVGRRLRSIAMHESYPLKFPALLPSLLFVSGIPRQQIADVIFIV